jgi:hypothetical protein
VVPPAKKPRRGEWIEGCSNKFFSLFGLVKE